MRIVVIGAQGFVGSAFARHFRARGDDVVEVTRASYAALAGTPSDVVVEAACNSRKFWAEEKPFEEFEASVTHRLRTLRDFPTKRHLHLSSVDVYDDLTRPAATREDTAAVGHGSHYGFHKLIAESLVLHHAPRWLILRLAGMIGPGLRKNPVFDILNGHPLRIHPESRYQFMPTESVAALAAQLLDEGVEGEVFNLCGGGLISPREIAALAGCNLDLSQLPADAAPRVVDVSIEKFAARASLPTTHGSVATFIDRTRASH